MDGLLNALADTLEVVRLVILAFFGLVLFGLWGLGREK